MVREGLKRDKTCSVVPPFFPLSSDAIEILASPNDFYDQILDQITKARSTITLASLYLGTDAQERRLIDALMEACANFPDLQVNFLLDFTRGQRQHPHTRHSSVDMITRLLHAFPHQVHLHLYQVPSPALLPSLPSPFNETLGVFHIKAYLFDQRVIMTGANLSADYFTHRQDRYVMISSAALAQFYHEFISIISDFAFDVKSDESQRPPIKDNHRQLVHELEHFYARSCAAQSLVTAESENDTWVCPSMQFTPLGLSLDRHLLALTFDHLLKPRSNLAIASGYLNFPQFFIHYLLRPAGGFMLDILTAAPKANGFFNARGIKGAIPMAYSTIERQFYHQMMKKEENHRHSQLREYQREDWTFHAKGLWGVIHDSREEEKEKAEAMETRPNFTIMGSSNFGRRSYERDFESQLYLYTHNAKLKDSLFREYQNLCQHGPKIEPALWKQKDRQLHGWGWKSGVWIRPVVRIIGSFL